MILTVVLVLALGVVAIVCSTSSGADWLQRRWRPGGSASGADGLAEAADALGDAIEGGHDRDGSQLRGLARHPVDDA
jgi:hypothetical protein